MGTGMRLTDLDPHFVKREIRPCAGHAVEDCGVTSPHTQHEYHVFIDSMDDADGVWFDCPKCFLANGGPVGTHAILCWRPRVPPGIDPSPGRWELQGTGMADLTLVAGSSSIALQGGCAAHFYIRNGAIEMCP